jgi:Flp pilus assembly protein TadB
MSAIDFLDMYILYILGVTVLIYVIYNVIDTKKTKMENSLIEALNNIAQEIDAGNTIETAIMTVSKDKSNPSSKYFKEMLKETENGRSFEEAIKYVSKKTDSEMFSYICSIILLEQNSKGDISNSLKHLAQNLWEINNLQNSINAKAAAPMTTLKLLGIALVPVLYYSLAGALSSPGAIVEITLPLKVYFCCIALAITFTEYFLFGDYKEGLYLLPFTIAFMITLFLKIGPYMTSFFGG